MGSEPPETIILTIPVGRAARAAPYTQAQARSRVRKARSGNESKLTRAARLSRTFTLSLGIEHGIRFTEWEDWTRVRLVRVVIVGRGGIRVGERRRDAAGHVGEWGRRGTIRFLEELSWVGVVPCSRSRVGHHGWGREIGGWRRGGRGEGKVSANEDE